MPSGVSWPRYIKVLTASLISMFAGAQVVHHYYKPLEDLDLLVQEEVNRRLKSVNTREKG